jgi:hypothetical protein
MMPIGLFARRTGLTASALRFYADCGLLVPAEVDPVTGSPALPRDGYGALLRTAIRQVAEAVARRDTAKRDTAPGRTA